MTAQAAALLRTANNDFTAAVYPILYPVSDHGNLAFSPFSLHKLLGMIGMGARGETRSQIFSHLKITDTDDDDISNTYNPVISNIKGASSPKTFTFLMANRVFCSTGFSPNPDFVRRCREKFLTEFEQVDVSSAAAVTAATDKINHWIEANTSGMVKNVLKPDTLNTGSKITLVNGVYFKGIWDFRWDSHKPELFRGMIKAENVMVDMLKKRGRFHYAELKEHNAHAIALPMKGRLFMIIILPTAINGLINAKLQASIGSLLKGGKTLIGDRLKNDQEIELKMPKFKMEADIQHIPVVLQQIGIKQMFNPHGADFSGIADIREGLSVTAVMHKAHIEVNQEGGGDPPVATAEDNQPPPSSVIQVLVNHPFYYQVVDNSIGDIILLSGHSIRASILAGRKTMTQN